MNIPLLQEIKARILAEPEHFRMDTWSCGTAHCIAGWALVLEGWDPLARGSEWPRPPEEILELSLETGINLFYLSDWPDNFNYAYRAAISHTERAEIAARRIDHFIATGGAE